MASTVSRLLPLEVWMMESVEFVELLERCTWAMGMKRTVAVVKRLMYLHAVFNLI